MASLFGPGFDSPQVHNIDKGCQIIWQPLLISEICTQTHIVFASSLLKVRKKLLSIIRKYPNDYLYQLTKGLIPCHFVAILKANLVEYGIPNIHYTFPLTYEVYISQEVYRFLIEC